MPTAPMSRCTEPGCGALTDRGRCYQHTRKPWANPSANSRALTGADRNRFRREQLAREPQCRWCGSTHNLQADHITELADGGALFDPANGQTLCADCHALKTKEARRWRTSTGSRRK